MCRAREAIATTSLVGVREREKGLLGRGILMGGGGVVSDGWLERRWTCRVESQEAETRMLWWRSYKTDLTPAAWEERTVCAPVVRSILQFRVCKRSV